MAMGLRYIVSRGLGLTACLLLAPVSSAIYVRVELERVPVQRLITKLETALKKNPEDVQVLVNLARVHGMAYALKTDTAQVRKGNEQAPWFDYEPAFVPFSKVEKVGDANKQRAAE